MGVRKVVSHETSVFPFLPGGSLSGKIRILGGFSPSLQLLKAGGRKSDIGVMPDPSGFAERVDFYYIYI